MAAILAAELNKAQKAESAVNGAWNVILNHYFPQPGFIIMPELCVPGAGDTDLVVQTQAFANNAVTWTWHTFYEGKGVGSSDTWQSIHSQVATYPRSALARGATCWCIGAKARGVSFWKFRSDDMFEMKPVDVYHGNVRFQDSAGMPPVYDIVNDQVEISTVLRYIVRTP
ncbi:hypothetical protein PQX77_015970 [Marasmius sp. AFHP31]|nr:hypothetical protein PQX77_015970 [Marasmius sp. AFHP31]